MLKQYLSTNTKLKRDGIYSFGIPAYKAASGLITCPGASKCIKGCYARTGLYNMPSVKNAQEKRLELTQDKHLFIAVIDTELRKRKVKVLRIHDSGDFYSAEYLDSWLTIIRLNKETHFYAYTKNRPLFVDKLLPDNFTLIYSEGGKYDKLLDRSKERHSRVFKTVKDLKQAGYVDTSKSDKHAYSSSNNKIGLVYHGGIAKQWDTAS